VEDRQAAFAPFHLVLQVQGGPSPDGRSLLVEAVTVEGEMLRFDVALTDVQHLVAFLLVSADSCHRDRHRSTGRR
jgi:hypothetical protein